MITLAQEKERIFLAEEPIVILRGWEVQSNLEWKVVTTLLLTVMELKRVMIVKYPRIEKRTETVRKEIWKLRPDLLQGMHYIITTALSVRSPFTYSMQ